jgi:hypothetical protein
MSSTSELILSQQNEINHRLKEYLNGFLELCADENKKLFLNSLLYNHFFYKNSFGSDHEGQFNGDVYSFSNLDPIFLCNLDEGFDELDRKVIYEDCYKYKLNGFKFNESFIINSIVDNPIKDEFNFFPEYSIELGGNNYRIDFALIFIQIVNGQKTIKSKIAIECDKFEFNKTIEQHKSEVVKSRLLVLDKWKIYRLSESDIKNSVTIEGISKIIYDLRKLCNENNPFYK